MRFPLSKPNIYITSDADSFKVRNFKTETEIPIENHCGAFGTERKHDVHTGVDLYCNEGDYVHAIEGGTVVLIEHFTGTEANSPWWNDTEAVHIEGASGVLVYGEIEPVASLKLGARVATSQLLGKVKRVLKQDKGRPVSMLHMELYKHGSRKSCTWNAGETRDTQLLNPTDLLISLIN